MKTIQNRNILPVVPFNNEFIDHVVTCGFKLNLNLSAKKSSEIPFLHENNALKDYFIPMCVINENPGSNIGLGNLLEMFQLWASDSPGMK
jgi:hypothetical protein